MAKQDPQQPAALPRIFTGVPGLDQVTGGGFLKSGVYILQGAPGAGKTILANQLVHSHAAAGGKVVYVTMLAESHARLLQHMQAFSFFDVAAIPDKVYYVSAFHALRSAGLQGVVELLRNEMRAHGASVLVLDGLVMAAGAAGSDEELKIFISDLQTHSALTGCTTLLLASDDADHPVSAEQTMVDGILLLRERAFGPRRERNIEVVKFRGSATLRGNHAFQIGADGIVVYPRLESLVRHSGMDSVQPIGVSTGIAGLDRMFAIGGYPKGGVVAVSGISGGGKTTLALHFIAQCSPADKGLFFSFFESPEFLLSIARQQGIDVQGVLAGDAVEFMWQRFGENMLDEMAARLLRRVAQTKATRVVIDSVGGFMAASAFADRGGSFLAALTNELRRLGVTTLITVEEQEAGRPPRALDTPTMSALADTMMELRVTSREVVRRFVSVGKSRASRTDLRVREMALGPAGLLLLDEEPPVGV